MANQYLNHLQPSPKKEVVLFLVVDAQLLSLAVRKRQKLAWRPGNKATQWPREQCTSVNDYRNNVYPWWWSHNLTRSHDLPHCCTPIFDSLQGYVFSTAVISEGAVIAFQRQTTSTYLVSSCRLALLWMISRASRRQLNSEDLHSRYAHIVTWCITSMYVECVENEKSLSVWMLGGHQQISNCLLNTPAYGPWIIVAGYYTCVELSMSMLR